MMQNLIRFALSALLYGVSSVCASMIFIIPPAIVSLTIFLAPMLGLMWGPVAAAGVCVGGLIANPDFRELLIFGGDFEKCLSLYGMAMGLFLSSYLPCFLWYNLKMAPREFNLTTDALQKLIVILLITFSITSLLRSAMASGQELEIVKGLFGLGKNHTVSSYLVVCFFNDFFMAVFLDPVLFFILISKDYPFYNPQEKDAQPSNTPKEQLSNEESKALMVAAISYFIFPFLVAYLDMYQIYGMEDLETWTTFVVRCVTFIDAYIVLVTYLLLRYRRSIMLEIVFMVAIVVFMSAAVLGWGSSLSMSNMVKQNTDNSLRAMSVICRERLNRTFFCMRQAVNGMEHQAIKSLESYDRLAKDAAYRENYLASMEQIFESIARNTDGCFAFYLRLNPEIAGSKGGFSMARANDIWEGALSPFLKRDPIDLSHYSTEDTHKVGWYYTPLKTKCATWLEPYIDPLSDSYVISYVAPLFIEDKFIGVVGIDLDFNFVIQELRRMSVYNYGHVYLKDRNNIVMYHKDALQGTQFEPDPEYEEMEIYLTNGMWLGIATPLSDVYHARNRVIMYLVTAILLVAMVVSLGSIVLVSRAIRPLAGMTEAAKRIASGDLDVKISYESGNELGLLVRSIREMATKLEAYVYRDKLTGLRNAAAYMSKANELNAQSKISPHFSYAVVLFDVNFLKKVNDNHGHQAGNQLLRHASRVICRVFKHSPVYRVGGDEFVAVLEREDYKRRYELLCIFDENISKESFQIEDETINVSVARGIGIYEQGMTFAEVAKKADNEMYIHKAAIKAKYGEEVR